MSQPIPQASLEKIVHQFAPIAYFDSKEKYFPTSAEDFIHNCDEENRDDGLGLKLKNHDPETLAGNLADAKVYVNVKMHPEDEYIDIQYWFLYAYNGPGTLYVKEASFPHYKSLGDHDLAPCGEHEGDWEHITARVSFDGTTLKEVYFSQHDTGQWISASDLGNPDRPTFYASKFGHAAYADEGRNYSHFVSMLKIWEFRLVNDTSDPDQSVDAQGRCQIIGIHKDDTDIFDQYQIDKPDWMKYTGRWGAKITVETPAPNIPGVKVAVKEILEKMGIYGECCQLFGPTPPWEKSSWTGEE